MKPPSTVKGKKVEKTVDMWITQIPPARAQAVFAGPYPTPKTPNDTNPTPKALP